MTKKGMCTDRALPDKERMLRYKAFSVAFSYPDDEKLNSEYDKLFRLREIWLYTTEHLAKNEFQRANLLSDIMGFYRAFGVEPDKDRPDSLSSELEFMHYLIFKRAHALKNERTKEKALICLDAEKKFFREHLYPAAKKIAGAIISSIKKGHYAKISRELLDFLEEEKKVLSKKA